MPSIISRANLIVIAIVTVLGALYHYLPSLQASSTMDSDETQALSSSPNLEFKLSQISRSPPSLLVTLKNNNPSKYITILKWKTPLDASALNVGVFKLVDQNTGETIAAEGLMINRMMPPSREDLVSVAPGSEEAVEVVFDAPWLPKNKPAIYRVTAEGVLAGAWDRPGEELLQSDLEEYTVSPLSGRHYMSTEVMMRVE